MIETSESTAKLDEALAKAQGEIEAASKDKVNPAFKSKYADLASVWAAIRPAMSKYGISVTQWPLHSDDERLHIVTRLAHNGEWMRAHFSIPVSKRDAHGYGSAVTYAKRFSLAAAIGVVADEDDDGNGAVQRPMPKKDARPEYERLLRELRECPTKDAMHQWKGLRAKEINALPPEWIENLRHDYEEHVETLAAKMDAFGLTPIKKEPVNNENRH